MRDEFEDAIERALGDSLRRDNRLCSELWGSLANVDWKHVNGGTASYSFRAAGDLIARILGEGSYMDWYCIVDIGWCRPSIREAMDDEGWYPEALE